jgi:hypothetical protein
VAAQMLRWRGRSVSPLRFSPLILARPLASRRLASMSTIPPAPTFKPFNLALIQLGQVGADKSANLRHARDMIRRAANGEGAGIVQGKPNLVVLPVSTLCAVHATSHLKEVTCCPAGMLQLALWPRVFPIIRREYWVYTRREI